MGSLSPIQIFFKGIVASACAGFLYLLKSLPPPLAAKTLGHVAKTLGPFMPIHTLIKTNLAYALPSHKDPENLAKKIWQNLGMTVGEFPHIHTFYKNSNIENNIELIGEENLRYAASHGPVLFISGHFANWELFAVIAARYGAPFRRFYRPSNNPFLEKVIQHIRGDVPGGFIAKGTVREVVACLKNKENIGFLIDQKIRHGDEVMFLGHKTVFPSTPFELALRYNLPLIPARCERLGPAHHRITIGAPLNVPQISDPILKRQNLTQQMASLMESWIEEAPEDWLWLHDRWLLEKRKRPSPVFFK